MCVAVILEQDIVTDVPPIVKYMLGWKSEDVIAYSKKRGWTTCRI